MIIEFLRKLYVRQFLTPAYPSIPASELDMPAYERGKSDYESMPQKFLVAKVANPFEPDTLENKSWATGYRDAKEIDLMEGRPM
jgi:hypothetical protein